MNAPAIPRKKPSKLLYWGAGAALWAVAGVMIIGSYKAERGSDSADQDFAERAMASARDSMKDPTSVMFKDVTASAKAKCIEGMILAKNGLGAYTGYQSFVWINGQTHIDPGKLEVGPLIDNMKEWDDYNTASHNCGSALAQAMGEGPVLKIAHYPEGAE